MEEYFDMQDLNKLFHTSKPMHDDFITDFSQKGDQLILEYGRIGQWDGDYGTFQKVTVTYTLEEETGGVGLAVYKVSERGTRYVPLELEDLNSWTVILDRYSVDNWGEMTLFMSVSKGRRAYNAQLYFTPKSVRYLWE